MDKNPEATWDTNGYSAAVTEAERKYLHERNLDEVCSDHNLLADPQGFPNAVFYPGLADAGEHSEKIALPSEIMVLCDRLSTVYRKMSHSDFIRHSITLGLAIYYQGVGLEIERVYREKTDAILDCEPNAVASLSLSCTQESGFNTESFRINGHLYSMCTQSARHSGICRNQFYGYLVLLALKTHPRIPGWQRKISESAAKFEFKINSRLKALL